jgi:hypothetical protein
VSNDKTFQGIKNNPQEFNTNYQGVEIKTRNYEKRPEITNNTTHIEYFEELIFDRVNKCPLPKIESLNTVIRFDIVGHDAGSWTIAVEDGILKSISRNYFTSGSSGQTKIESKGYCMDNTKAVSKEVILNPVCIIRLSGRTFMSIVRREITPQQAFFEKDVQIEGDMTLALKMNVLVNYL